ncbi:MAG: site-specific integrase [Ferruginibacter sp.]
MKKYTPTVTLFLDTRIEKISGKYPLKLTVYCKPMKKRYKTKIDLTEAQWTRLKSDNLRDSDLKSTKIKINALVSVAGKIIENLNPFSFAGFEKHFYENATDLNGLNLSSLFKEYIAVHNKKGNVGTVLSYQSTLNSLNGFKSNLSLYDINPDFLEEYELYMKGKGKSNSTIGIYLRQLRAVFNNAVSRNLISKENYPFGKNRYKIPVGSNIKKALSPDDLQILLKHTPDKKEEQKALDFWIFSFLSNGINFCDILRLRPENIKNNFICYIRSKTKNTKKGTQQIIRVPVHPRAKVIINKWKNTNVDGIYLFPFLKEGLSPIQEKYFIQGFIKNTNKNMEAIRLDLKISEKCNTYSCRHSFATVLKRKNVNTEFISESLGHSSILTTSAYLASFEDKTKIEYSNLLTDL